MESSRLVGWGLHLQLLLSRAPLLEPIWAVIPGWGRDGCGNGRSAGYHADGTGEGFCPGWVCGVLGLQGCYNVIHRDLNPFLLPRPGP